MTDDRADEVYDLMMAACCHKNFSAADVVYALGKMIAHSIAEHAVDKDPTATFNQLRDIVDLELPLMQPS